MNFLAHQHLSFHVTPVMVGNFIADTIRGSNLQKYPSGIQVGIQVHRAIDNFTDTHEVVLETRALLYPYFSKYAAVVQDVFYDHFLALNWERYSTDSFHGFIADVYRQLRANEKWMNERALLTLQYMHSQDWLGSYIFPEGIDRALKGLGRRAKFHSNMENSLPALEKNFDEIHSQFHAFYPELIADIKTNFETEISVLGKL